VIKKAPTRALGPSKKTKSSSITSEPTAKAAGVPSLRLQVCHLGFFFFFFSFLITLLINLFHVDSLGLDRCGKSCRLRWINYLRPDIKRGNFGQDEEDLIIKLHALLGNRYFSQLLFDISMCVRNLCMCKHV
jgi:hypothetical protein